MNFKSDEHLECELDARICAGVVEDLSRTLNEATRIIKILVASAHRNERDYMPAEWHDAIDDAKLFLAGMMAEKDTGELFEFKVLK